MLKTTYTRIYCIGACWLVKLVRYLWMECGSNRILALFINPHSTVLSILFQADESDSSEDEEETTEEVIGGEASSGAGGGHGLSKQRRKPERKKKR